MDVFPHPKVSPNIFEIRVTNRSAYLTRAARQVLVFKKVFWDVGLNRNQTILVATSSKKTIKHTGTIKMFICLVHVCF